MKKTIITIALLLTLGMNVGAVAQKHRHHPRTEVVDSTQRKDAVEAYSDTTATVDDATNVDEADPDYTQVYGEHLVRQMFSEMDGSDLMGIIITLVTLLILFVIAPIGIIIAVFYFINRNRREKYRLAQMAMQNGQPIPGELLRDQEEDMGNDGYNKGVRQMFEGVGLAIFLGLIIGKIGIGIGALVFFTGLGKWYTARRARQEAGRFHGDPNPHGGHRPGYGSDAPRNGSRPRSDGDVTRNDNFNNPPYHPEV